MCAQWAKRRWRFMITIINNNFATIIGDFKDFTMLTVADTLVVLALSEDNNARRVSSSRQQKV